LDVVDMSTRAENHLRHQALRVLLVDDHQIVRTGIRHVLESSDQIVVVEEAGDAGTAFAKIDDADPDVVLLDIGLPDRNGIDVAHQLALTHPEVQVVMLTATDDDDAVRAAFDVGAAGYLLKAIPGDELIGAVLAVGRGDTVIDPLLARHADAVRGRSRARTGGDLTWRERATVELVAQGLSNKAVATRLGLSVRTVEGHLNHAFAKLGVESRTELVRRVLTRAGDARPAPD
jgi:DNA-binding NarL/FixJ family response regulator